MATKITNKQVKIVSTVDFNRQEITNALIDANHNTITNLDTGKVDDVKVNGTSVVTNKIADIQIKTINGTEIIGEGDVEIQSPILTFTNIGATNWIADNTYTGYGYKCDLVCEEVTESMVPQVTFASTEADSGNYCAICDSGTDKITIYSKVNTAITVPTITATNTTQEPPTPTEFKGLKFTAVEDNSSVGYIINGTPMGTDMQYSYNGTTWTQWDGTSIPLNNGEFIYVKGDNSNGLNSSGSHYINFTMTGKINASGNTNSLLDNNDGSSITAIPNNGCYASLFKNCTSLVTSPELPVTTLSNNCYGNMFSGCKALVTAPVLPATTLTNNCYAAMFYNCTSLIQAPELPATSLADNCYQAMFYTCISLTIAPELPATSLADNCYQAMFYTCISLTIAPELPATSLTTRCYENMFQDCSSLIKVPEISATTLAGICFSNMFDGCSSLKYIKINYTGNFDNSFNQFTNWVQNVSSTGDFYYNGSDTSNFGISAIPTGWTVHTF